MALDRRQRRDREGPLTPELVSFMRNIVLIFVFFPGTELEEESGAQRLLEPAVEEMLISGQDGLATLDLLVDEDVCHVAEAYFHLRSMRVDGWLIGHNFL